MHPSKTQPVPRHRVLAKVTQISGGAKVDGADRVLTPDALLFLADLERRFGPQRRILLEDRQLQQDRFDDGELPSVPLETLHIRNSAWEVDPAPDALTDRRVEITGPVSRKMMINAFNSGATQFMADFEDASSPHLRQHGRGTGQHDRLHRRRIDAGNGQEVLRRGRQSGDAARASARLALRAKRT